MHAIEIFSYLDAGTGSVIFQSLIGVVAGVAVFGRRFFYGIGHKLRSIFSRSSSSNSSEK